MQTFLDFPNSPLALPAIALRGKSPSGGSEPSSASRYQLQRQLGAGTDGVVYLGRSAADGREVEFHVIEKAFANGRRRDELTARLKVIQLLRHPAKVEILELLLDHLPPAVAMERVGEQTLFDLRSLELPEALDRAIQLCDVLAEAHRLALYHGRLSPQALFLDGNGELRIDFTDLRTGLRAGGNARAKETAATLVDDVAALARVLRWMLVDRIPLRHDATQLRGREFAALKQLILGSESDGLHATDFASCLEQLRAALPSPPGALPQRRIGSERETTAVNGGPAIAAHSTLRPGDQIGRYEIKHKLSESINGTMFRAEDLGSGAAVAVKVLHASMLSRTNALKRFEKEARVLATVNNPYLANLLEVNQDAGRHFLAMEFVDGETLKDALEKHRPLKEQHALQIAADVARGLTDAHALGIVHRAIKPENISLRENPGPASGRQHWVRLLDFGLAQEIDRTGSAVLPRQASMVSAPSYLSPEQCKGKDEIGPASDVYALGVTLYEMLCGQPPFAAAEPLKLAAMHCFDSPPDLRKKNPQVSDAAALLVNRALSKQPVDRPTDAAHFLREVDLLLRGPARDVSRQPLLPPHDSACLVELDLEWDMPSTAEELWPHVSNTQRLQQVLGLAPASNRPAGDSQRCDRRLGTADEAAQAEEYSLEWIEARRLSMLQEFHSGPYLWTMHAVELEPKPTGGTVIRHRVRIAPRHLRGSWLAKIEARWRLHRSLERIYRGISASLNGRLPPASKRLAPLPEVHQRRLNERIHRLVQRGVAPELAARLGEYVATASPQEITRMRPAALAGRFGFQRGQVLDACLLAAAERMIALAWEVACPVCRAAADTKTTLADVSRLAYCRACDLEFLVEAMASLELVFRVHPEVRPIDSAARCIEGPQQSPYVIAQFKLGAGERIEFPAQLSSGEYLLRGPRLANHHTLAVKPEGASTQIEIELRPEADERSCAALRSGTQLIQIASHYDQSQTVRVERTAPQRDRLTAVHAAAWPLFRKLFPRQVLDPRQAILAEQVTLQFTAVSNVDSMVSDLGESLTWRLIQKQLEVLEQIIHREGGAAIKIVGEGVYAAWGDCTAAVRAAARLQSALDAEGDPRKISLATGLHRGPALLTTLNDRLDYVGTTPRVAVHLAAQASAGVVLSEPVYGEPEVAQLLKQEFPASRIQSVDLPGAPGSLIMQLSASILDQEANS